MTRKHAMELSRRKILAGLGAVGAASAGAGLGSTAYFSDEESFKNNSLTAGELDTKAKWQVKYKGASESLGTHVESSTDEDVDALTCDATFTRPTIDLKDVKPGDKVLVRFDLLSCTNPGYLWMNGGIQANKEKGLTEPEQKDPDEPGIGTLGELPSTLATQVYVRPGQTDFVSIEELTGHGNTALDGEVQTVFNNEVSLAQAMSTLSSGLGMPLQGDVSSMAGSRNCFSGSKAAASNHQVALEISAPTALGNQIQSDEFSLAVGFYGEQCRHNDGSGLDEEAADPTIEASNSAPGVATTHGLRVPVDGISTTNGFTLGDDLDTLKIDYPDGEGFDVNGVSNAGGSVEKSGGNNVPLSPSVNVVDATTLELQYNPGTALEAGDAIGAFISNVMNASSAGSYSVDITVNGAAAGTATLTLETS